MPKRLLERCAPDSVREFRSAARERFQDAVALAEAGRRTAAIYLWGYTAEMTLKAAYFTLLGLPEWQPITINDLRGAAANAQQLGVSWPGPSRFHDLRAWAELLAVTRASQPGLAYPSLSFGTEVLATGRSLQLLWSETLRYHKNIAYDYEVNKVLNAAHWLLINSSQL